MANEKTYPNYLMHYRTKGSKNGISTTKGYNAVGQRARGRWVNGRYVYDTPKSYGGNVENVQSGRVSKPLSPYVSDEYLREIEYNSRNNDGSYELHPTAESIKTAHDVYVQSEANKNAMNAAYEYARKHNAKQNAKKPTNVGASQAANSEYGNRMTTIRKTKNSGRYVDDEYSKNLEYNSRKNQFSKKPRPSNNLKGALNNWQQQGNTYRAANEAWERFGSGKSRGITGQLQKDNYGGFGQNPTLEGSTRAMNALAGLGKLRREKKNLSLYGSGDTKTRNSRSDIANAFADAKADAKNAFKTMKKKALLNIFNKSSLGVRKDKKKKKSWKDFFK